MIVVHPDRVDPSIGSADAWHLSARHMEKLVLDELHPDYHRLARDFVASEALAEAQQVAAAATVQRLILRGRFAAGLLAKTAVVPGERGKHRPRENAQFGYNKRVETCVLLVESDRVITVVSAKSHLKDPIACA